MKTLIISFSQTGNTRKIADCIQEGIGTTSASCTIVNLTDVDKDKLGEYDLVGLGCPTFYYREPFNVREFMDGLVGLEGKSWFVFCSHGSVMGETLISMADCLEQRGIVVIGSHHSYADGTLPFYPYPTVTTGHPDEQELQEARDFGKAIAECAQAVAGGDTSRIAKPAPLTDDFVPAEISMLTREFMDQVFRLLSVNVETCTECGECMDACPVNGIDIEADPRKIQDPCVYCWNCAKVCPTCSIEADWSGLIQMAPANYEKYIKALKAAEARGEFRWLMDPDTLNFDDPLHKQQERRIE
ncbi:MAG: 4Fe-4S dicluster domain-containing protein [Proteobacteria bacterium]|nr:4Fe-4S dicluster domain-containing protein [Pseudomonadota bacterium]